MGVRMIAERRNPRRVREARARAAARLKDQRDREWEKNLARLHEIILRDRPRGGAW